MDSIVSVIVEFVKDPINEFVVSPLRRRISYAFNCNSRVKTLQDEVGRLKKKRSSLQMSVDDAKRSAQKINPNVREWLSTAETHIGQAEELVQKKDEAEKKCFVGLCPNFKTRYHLSKNAVLKTTEIQNLLNKQGIGPIAFRPHLVQIPQPGKGEPLSSRVSMLNQIMDALRDDDLNMIGVWGMGGIGKTVLAFEVQAKALQERLFEIVIVVVVSQTPELRRIQADIADFLGLKFDAEEIRGRASQLYLGLQRSRVLIIFDDIWEKLDLDLCGIPTGDESKACKIMLTSRNKNLLSSEMGAQKLFPLEALEEAESLSLFESVAEPKDLEFHAIATEIVRKGAGLPLLIQLVAEGLKDKESYAWKNTLNQLSSFENEVYDRVYKVLKSSYENLHGMEIKLFFLLCALFGQPNILIQYLLTYSMGLDLFKHIPTVDGARNRVFTLIDELKANSLLLDGDMVGFVKMHELVRITALRIACREHHAFVGSGLIRSMDWPKYCTRISLPFCGISELPVGLNYPEAELFSLFTEDLSLKIPDSFFNGIIKLKVVNLTGMRLVPLPSSIGLLANLRSLYLHKCQLDNVSILGELKQLEFLSFANSNIVELPREIELLTGLRLLDVSCCSNLQFFPANVLSKLRSLEELYMLNSFVGWDSKGNVSLVELENLVYLSTVEIQIPDLKLIPVGFKCFNRLRHFKISVGNIWDWDEPNERLRTLKLKGETGFHLEDGTGLLVSESEDLYIDGVMGIESIFSVGFPKLKHLHVENDFGIRHLIKSTILETSFPVLESLHLNKLHVMEKICRGQLRMGSFGKLQILNISNCEKLKCLLSLSSAKCLQQLQELEVADCENMETVVGEGREDDQRNNEVIEFTQLSSLKMKSLPHLLGFCNLKEETEQMGLLFSTMVSFPNLTSLEVSGCRSLKHIFTATMVTWLLQFKNLKIKDCDLDDEIIQSKLMEEIEEEDSTETIVFPKLETLTLVNLKNVKRFSSYCVKFPLLTELTIEDCYAMRNSVAKVSSSQSGEEEHLFNEMATFSNRETMNVERSLRDGGLPEGLQPHEEIKKIHIKYYMGGKLPSWMLRSGGGSFVALDNLVDLKLEWCYNFAQAPCLGNLPHLKFLEMNHMGKVKFIDNEFYGIDYAGSSNGFSALFPALQSLSLSWMENLTGWSSPSDRETVVAFPRLQNLSIQYCPKLTGFPMSDLSELVRLEIKDCEELMLIIDKQQKFTSLMGLSITGCPKLSDLQNWFHRFKELSVRKCEWLTFIPFDLKKVSYLTSLEIYCCRRLRYFPEDIFSELTKLQNLSVGAFSGELDDFHYLNRIKDLPCLEELEIWGSDFFGREMRSLPNQLQNLSAVKSLKIMGFTAMEALPEWLTNLQTLQSLSLDYCRKLGCNSTATIIQRLPNLLRLSVSSCPIFRGIESERLQPSYSRKIELEVSHVSKVRVRLGY